MKFKKIAAWLVFLLAVTVASDWPTLSEDKPVPKPKPKSVLVESIQPDYAKWNSIAGGMTEARAKEILGKPIFEDKIPDEYLNNPSYVKQLVFGRIKFDSPSIPDSFEFYIHILQGKVDDIRHPFDGELSTDGTPTKPKLIYPRDMSKFDHYPRFVDLRWTPSSGKYPIEYAVDIEFRQAAARAPGEQAKFVYRPWRQIVTELPYAAIAFGGGIPGRWRVRAKNDLGESDWTEWRQFEFKE